MRVVGMVCGQRRRGHLYWGHGCCRLMAETGGGGLGIGVVGVLGRRCRRQRLLLSLLLRLSLLLLLLLLLRRWRLRRRHRAGSGTLLTPVVLAVGAGLGRRAPRSPLALAAAAAAAVGLDVLREMVAAHEPLVADRAGESLFAGVGSKVPQCATVSGPSDGTSFRRPCRNQVCGSYGCSSS